MARTNPPKKIKIVFFGTPEFVIPIPEILLKSGFQLVACITAPDKPVGRKQILSPSPVKKWAKERKIKVIDSPKIAEIEKEVKNIGAEVGILAAYGKIIPKTLIEIFPKGILVIHPSLLPKYRGSSPVQAAIALGEEETGVSVFKMDEEIDHGPLIWQTKEKISPEDTALSLYQRLFKIAAKNLPKILEYYIFGCDRPKICNIGGGKFYSPPKPQNHQKASYTPLLRKKDGFIPGETLGFIAPKPGFTSKCKIGPYDLEPTPENLERFIRAMTPWPGTWTTFPLRPSGQLKRLKILKAHLENKKLVPNLVQIESKKPVSFKEFKKAYLDEKFNLNF